jgi:hypothetical protein
MKNLSLVIVVASGCASQAELLHPDSLVDQTGSPTSRKYDHPVHVDHMLRGYFYAGSDTSEGLGGNATSDNMPRPLSALNESSGLAAGLHVLALFDQDRPFDRRFDGFRVIVANTTSSGLVFEAQDSRLAIVHEAIDESGKWAPIEYLPQSWCGNSYHQLTLPAHSYWEFTAPHYDGEFTTRLRIRVAVRDDDHERLVYSNEFAGSIHKTQFTTKQGHHATNVMDPYDE